MSDEETKNKEENKPEKKEEPLEAAQAIGSESQARRDDSVESDDIVEFEFNDDGEEDLKKTLKKFRADLKVCKSEKEEYLTGWQKERAEFANYKKGEDDRKAMFSESMRERILSRFLSVIDSFNMAFANRESWEKVDENWRKGVEYIYGQMNTIFEEYGVKEIGKGDFTINEDELALYKKVDIELPTLCFSCRVKLHLSFWMFGKFRKGVSDLSGENLITVLSENSRYPIYTSLEWYSDKWDALNYGMDYDSKLPFLKQLQNLQEKVPRPHQTGTKNTKCDYCDDVWNSKNCYLSRSMEHCENLFYSYRNIRVKNSIDATICFNCEKSYDISECHNSFKLFYSKHSRDCIDSYFLYDCRNCQDCFMCWNL